MAEKLTSKDWQNVSHGTAALRRVASTFENLGPSDKPVVATKVFKSTVQSGTGSAQSIAHGLGVVPSIVMIIPQGNMTDAARVIEGTHTATNVVVTATASVTYIVIAIAV